MSLPAEFLLVDRRKLLQIASMGLFAATLPDIEAQNCTNVSDGVVPPYTAQFFTQEELDLLARVMESILPADEHSPGAGQAQVPLFADLIVYSSPDDVKTDWRSGLRLLAAELKHSGIEEWLSTASSSEQHPRSVLDLFFVKLKQMTVDGYYTSQIGIHEELQYQGNTYVRKFEGCTHAEHQSHPTALSGRASHRPDDVVDQPAG